MKQANAAWITGVGTATPLGHTYPAFADHLLAGRSGVDRVRGFDVSEHPSQIAGQLCEVPCPSGIDAEEFGRLHRLEQLMRWCCIEALRDSGWWDRRSEVRIGVVLGVGAEWLEYWEADALAGGRRVYQPEQDAESMIARTRRVLGLRGPAVSVSAACASGNVALSQARHWLELGWVDLCLAGACDMAVTPMALAGFGNLRALSRRNAEPQAASRPFDRQRDGFVMGDGGAVFLLEPAALARRRGARAYAEVAGYGARSDAFNMVIPSSDPEPAIAAVREALHDAGCNPDDVDYINAHATSTPVGDIAEARVLTAVFGDRIQRLPISSTKSMTGHLLTAAAAVEALACLVAMERDALPPTINLHEPDPECLLCHVAHESRTAKVRVAVSNSFGFGGSNTCLVLKAV
ncbi:MAG TPA: beta-ketoacyl-[acyl-carrier-protein] synthase family protein [Gemmataceae bacterium]|nr:beta-ketoacyl-[acyl-carrier-protein] synthase family protein [Gemmataceae bacterium]